MGFLDKFFGRSGKKDVESLVLCLNRECGRVFKESQGLKPRKDINLSGLGNYQCPFCGNEFACSRSKFEEMQAKLRKKLKEYEQP